MVLTKGKVITLGQVLTIILLSFLIGVVATVSVYSKKANADPFADHSVHWNQTGKTSKILVDLPYPRNCVYVTDCGYVIADPPAEVPPSPPVAVDPYENWERDVMIDRTGWIAYADDEEPNGGTSFKAMAAIDGDPMTIWHTTWSADVDPLLPHHIIIDMGAKHYVDQFIYQPRPFEADKAWSMNGNILDYEVWVSDNYTRDLAADGTLTQNGTWARVAHGTFVYDTPNQVNKVQLLVPNEVRYVKLVAKTADGTTPENKASFASAGEIWITEMLPDVVITGGGVI